MACYLGRELLDFDTIKLVDIDLGHQGDIDELCVAQQVFHNLNLEQAQILVGDDQEIATTTGWIQKL